MAAKKKRRGEEEFDGELWQDKFAEEIAGQYSEEDLLRVWAQLERTRKTVTLAIIKARQKRVGSENLARAFDSAVLGRPTEGK